MSAPIPALSIRQPWAELIASGRKTVEVRAYDTPYRGDLWLHTGKTVDIGAMEHFGFRELQTGGYLGIVTLELIVPLDSERWSKWQQKHLDTGSFSPGFFGWVLGHPRRLSQAVSGPGQLKLFWPEKEVLEELERSMLQ